MDTHIRNLIDGVYDIQKLRIATGNRIVAALRGEPDPEKEAAKTAEQKEKEQKEKDSVLAKVLKEYKRITDVYVERYNSSGPIVKAITADHTDFIKTKVDYTLVQQYMKLLDAEDGLAKVVETEVKQHPMWDAFFADVRGCGPLMSAICLAYLDPHKARHASSFWKYCGLDVVVNEETGEGEGRGRKHCEMRPYIDKEGNEKERKSLTYNPFVKTKLVEVLMSSFLRAKESHYGKVYYDYKHRISQREKEISPLHRHRMAARYAVKMFLRDMWVVWRELEGLEVSEPYEVAKLGHKPHGT